jgi:hypothetical protein
VIEKDTCTTEMLEEMKDDDIDSIMKEIMRTEYKHWEDEEIIQSASFYNNVINETVQIVRTIRKNLETEMMEKREYTEDPDDPTVPNILNTLQFVECDNYMTKEGAIKFNLDYVSELSKNNQKEQETEITENIQSKEEEPLTHEKFDWQEEEKEIMQVINSSMMNAILKVKFEEIYGIDTFKTETLYEMEEDEVDGLMEEVRNIHYDWLKSEGFIQNIDFYSNVVNGTVELTRTIRKKLENETVERRIYLEDPDDPSIPNEFEIPRFTECNYDAEEDSVKFNFDYI